MLFSYQHRSIVSGSMGKGTHILNSFNVDLVVFINEAFPPFGEELDRIEELLYLNFNNFKILHKSPFSLQCTTDYVDFDILLASNLVTSNSASDSPREAQHKQLMINFNSPSTTCSAIRSFITSFRVSQ